MDISAPIPSQPAGRTFYVAITLLGVTALAQIVAVAWSFGSKFQASSAVEPALPGQGKSDVPDHLTLIDPFALPAGTAARSPAAPPLTAVQPTAIPEASKAPIMMASLPKPTPVPVVKPTTEAQLTDLLGQARALRENGDTSTALTRLREAQAISPDSALVISELATTFEKMGQTDKAMEQWRRIYDMGESAGIYYQAADAKLKTADTPAQPYVKPEMNGIQPGSVLGLGEMATVDLADPVAQKKILLKIPLKARPGSSIEVKDVVIQVFFYDMLDGTTIVQTNANVSSRWSTLPADWKDADAEILEVEYTQPLKTPRPTENRAYYGYVVRVYYKGELQDWRADQDKLRAKFPPPLTLASDQAQ